MRRYGCRFSLVLLLVVLASPLVMGQRQLRTLRNRAQAVRKAQAARAVRQKIQTLKNGQTKSTALIPGTTVTSEPAQSTYSDPTAAEPTALSDSVKIEDFEFKDQARRRAVKVRVYRPDADHPLPVILYSHGLGGSSKNNPYLGTFWAEHGYVAVFMQHTGSDAEVMKNAKPIRRMLALKQAASPQNAQARLADVSFVLNELTRADTTMSHKLYQRLDLEHVGLSGHSFGAITTMTMAGRTPPSGKRISEPRIDAFLAMSPQLGRGNPKSVYGNLQRPIFCMTGTKDGNPIDRSVSPESRQQVYESLPPNNKYHLVLDGAEHHAFSDSTSTFRKRERDPAHHGIIQELSLAFWDAYLKGDGKAKQWLQSNQPKQSAGFKSTDLWTWK